MDIVKPDPIQLGERYLYTLSNYDPVEVEVFVPSITDEDVEVALEELVRDKGASRKDITDEWVKENVEGLSTLDELKADVRSQLTEMTSYMAEREKAEKCAERLAERLGQKVPEGEIARVRAAMMASFQQEMADSGMDITALKAQGGPGLDQIEAMIDADARVSAERDAALSAYASERKLSVDETEYPALLGLAPKGVAELIEDARKVGQSESLRLAALNAKALRTVVDECHCSYRHETAEEAQNRIAQMRISREVARRNEDADATDSGFKLV